MADDAQVQDWKKVTDSPVWQPLLPDQAVPQQLAAQIASMPKPQAPQVHPFQPLAPQRQAMQGGGGGGGSYHGGGQGAALLRDAAAKAGFTGEALNMAVAIGMAESGGNPNATNTAGNSAGTDRGLWQINDYYHRDMFSSGLNWSDPYANARAAFQISGGGKNWGPWSTYGSGAYRRYL